MEILDLYTADRERTGKTIVRGEEDAPEGYYRLVVHICIFNEQGLLLTQQRQPFKVGWPGKWDISVGGSAVAGENSQMAAERETHEELGLSFDFSKIRPFLTVHWSGGFDDYYVLTENVDLDSLHLQEEEVQAVCWRTKEEILQMIDSEEFVPYSKGMIELLFHFYSRRSALNINGPLR